MVVRFDSIKIASAQDQYQTEDFPASDTATSASELLDRLRHFLLPSDGGTPRHALRLRYVDEAGDLITIAPTVSLKHEVV